MMRRLVPQMMPDCHVAAGILGVLSLPSQALGGFNGFVTQMTGKRKGKKEKGNEVRKGHGSREMPYWE